MTITKDDLRQYALRDNLKLIATAISYFVTCYNAVPGYPENDKTRDDYLTALLKQVKDMEEAINGKD